MEQARRRILTHAGLRFTAWERGEEHAPVALCLHGFPDHAGSFEPLMAQLAAAGYRAVAPMMRGYEPTSQSATTRCDMPGLMADVLAWMDQLGAEKIHLIGHDWGAVVAYLVGAAAPTRLASLTTLAVPPPGPLLRKGLVRMPSQLRRSWYMGFFHLWGFADARVAQEDFAFVDRLWEVWSPEWQAPPGHMRRLKEILREPGVLSAALSYYRPLAGLLGAQGEEIWRLWSQPIPAPTLALTGARDGCIDTRLFDLCVAPEQFPAGVRVERLAGCGHFLHLERPQEVGALVLGHLAQHPAGGRRVAPQGNE